MADDDAAFAALFETFQTKPLPEPFDLEPFDPEPCLSAGLLSQHLHAG
jgi:hypothetical protein